MVAGERRGCEAVCVRVVATVGPGRKPVVVVGANVARGERVGVRVVGTLSAGCKAVGVVVGDTARVDFKKVAVVDAYATCAARETVCVVANSAGVVSKVSITTSTFIVREGVKASAESTRIKLMVVRTRTSR